MKPQLKARIIAYNKTLAERKDKADDMDKLMAAFLKLPYGQIKKVLTDDVIAIFEKYGVTSE